MLTSKPKQVSKLIMIQTNSKNKPNSLECDVVHYASKKHALDTPQDQIDRVRCYMPTMNAEQLARAERTIAGLESKQ